jgi:alpha-galactosidase
VGNGVLTTEEERSHFGLWAILKSPLILGTDLTKISSASLAIIKNAVSKFNSIWPSRVLTCKGVISINQDSLGQAAAPFTSSTGSNGQLPTFWAGPLSDGVVVGLINSNDAATISVDFSDVPGLGAGTWAWTEFYTGASGTGSSVSIALGTHDMAVIKVTNLVEGSTRIGNYLDTTSSPIYTHIFG